MNKKIMLLCNAHKTRRNHFIHGRAHAHVVDSKNSLAYVYKYTENYIVLQCHNYIVNTLCDSNNGLVWKLVLRIVRGVDGAVATARWILNKIVQQYVK